MITAWVGGISALAVAGAVWFAIDAYGDHKTFQCHSAYAKATGATNLEIGDLNSDEAQAEMVAQAMRLKALEAARKVPGGALASKEQAKALTEIR